MLSAAQPYKICVSPDPECTREEGHEAFKKKVNLEPYQNFQNDPYRNQTDTSMAEINAVLADKKRVCAIQYQDEQKITYVIRDFASKEEAESQNFIVTHQGRCNVCSTLQDLSVYLGPSLMTMCKKCFTFAIFSEKSALKCLEKLGFTEPCAWISIYQYYNSKKYCLWPCLYDFLTNQPYNKPDGSLNNCLQCDEDHSGSVYKYFAGRYRRNSGIPSEIKRKDDELYQMTHCYF